MDHQIKLVIDALKKTLNNVKPLNYERVWVYEDSCSKIEGGMRNGEVFIIERDWME